MNRKLFVLTLSLFFFVELFVFPVHAAMLGLDTYTISEKEQTTIISNIRLEVVQDDNYRGGIQRFDVNQNGNFALAMRAGSDCLVYVYDSNSVFLYGYKFYCDGDYAIGFHEDMLAVFVLRGKTIALYDADGICRSVRKVSDTNNNLLEIKNILNQTSKDMGEIKYVLERDMNIGDSYSRLVSISKSGERTALYDVSDEHSMGQIVFILFVCVFFLFVVRGVYRSQKSKNKS